MIFPFYNFLSVRKFPFGGVTPITSMIAAGTKKINAILVVADRELFTPCGGCLDWIMQFGTEKTVVAFQAQRNGPFQKYLVQELMPHYPK